MRILIAGTENISWNLYNGNQRSMLITNCIFRLGGVALLLSNHPADRRRAKYRLTRMVRTHLGGVDEAYKCALPLSFTTSTFNSAACFALHWAERSILVQYWHHFGQALATGQAQIPFWSGPVTCSCSGSGLCPAGNTRVQYLPCATQVSRRECREGGRVSGE